MSKQFHDNFYETLFEVSNKIRHDILLMLEEKPEILTHIANKLELTFPEARRHLSRLSESNLIKRELDNHYHLTYYGEALLQYLEDFYFLSENRKYFSKHNPSKIPRKYLRTRLAELSKYDYTDNLLTFLHFIETNIQTAEKFVLFIIDQYPLTAIDSIIKTAEKGVKIKIIENQKLTGPNISFDESHLLAYAGEEPQVEINTIPENEVYLYASDKGSAISFPTDHGYDYTGFVSTDPVSIEFCSDLFNEIWKNSKPKTYLQTPQEALKSIKKGKTIILEGTETVPLDFQAIQNAVDNYDEVILKGKFNTGTSSVVISKSVNIKGEGREDDVPVTKVYKSGWNYPIIDNWVKSPKNRVFCIDEDNIDVTIENIHFTDFEYNCIGGFNGNSLTIKNNRITLRSGFGRGLASPLGNQIIGFLQNGGFPGGVTVEGNYLDFAQSFGPLQRILRSNEVADDPNYRPDLTDVYNYIAFGIDIFNACGEVIIENNIVRNVNSRGIVIADNPESADIIIKDNFVFSDIYGSYFGPKPIASFGILACSGYHIGSAPHIEILGNTVRCDKINYCGIGLQGPEVGPKGAMRFNDGIVKDNNIHLEDGSMGIFTESLENSQISGNTISGKAYYGIGIFPEVNEDRPELGSCRNVIENNDMSDLKIKDPDNYSKSIFDEKKYPGSKAGSATSYVWLSTNTKANRVKVSSIESVVDEGTDNQIIRIGK